MNLKYYLRGLGIGTIVTALILGIALGNPNDQMSNEEIKQRAKELGMVEGTGVLTDGVEEPEQALQPTEKPAEPEPTIQPTEKPAEPEPTIQPTEKPAEPEPTIQPTEKPAEPEPTIQPTREPENSEMQSESAAVANGKIIEIEVNRGDDSYAICEHLQQAGLIEDAAAFDTYLCENGYHTKIYAGIHKIPAGATKEEIIKLLCR